MHQQVFITAVVISSLLMTASLSAAKSFPVTESAAEGTTEQKLQLISSTPDRLEFNFFSAAAGIHILSQLHSNGQVVQVSVSTMNGETLFAVDRPIDNSESLLTIDGSEFLMINNTQLDGGSPKLTEYAVPEAYSLSVKNALKRHMLTKSLLRHLDRENVNSSGRSAIDKLLMRPEVELIATAASALGNSGIHGYENPAAMVFYTTALRFSSAIAEHELNEGGGLARSKRGWVDWLFGSYCSNSDSYCYSRCPEGPSCSGMCGPGCTCWWWVCADCCWNVGCYIHDVHSCSGGRDSLLCWLTAPIALICS